jgi:hypothetical protein
VFTIFGQPYQSHEEMQVGATRQRVSRDNRNEANLIIAALGQAFAAWPDIPMAQVYQGAPPWRSLLRNFRRIAVTGRHAPNWGNFFQDSLSLFRSSPY